MYNAFHPRFHLIYNEELEKNAFLLNGDAYNVPCVFQIWEKNATDRPKEEKVAPVGFEYVAPTPTPTPTTFALRRVGGLAGKCYPVVSDVHRSAQSHYFIRFNESAVPVKYHAQILERVNKHTFPSNTVGPRSLSKSEVNVVLNRIIAEETATGTATAAP
jgi:hypothetical protein